MRSPRRLRAHVLLVWLLAILVPASTSHADDIAAELEVTIHLKVLSFDAALGKRLTGDALLVAVVHPPESQAAQSVVSVFTQLDKKKVTVHRKRLRAVAVPLTADLGSRLPSGVGAIYVTAGATADQVAAVARLAQSRSVPTLSGNRSYLPSGLAIAVVGKSGKPSIVIHASNAKRSGMSLDPKLLRLAEVIK